MSSVEDKHKINILYNYRVKYHTISASATFWSVGRRVDKVM